jgi:hypothetical protein
LRINLTGGDSQARSVVASTQRRLNVYAELSDPKTGEPGQVTWYPTPGLVLKGVTPNGLPIRGMYTASNGDLYVVAGSDVYWVDSSYNFNAVGNLLATTAITYNPLRPIKMSDNGVSVAMCNGYLTDGWSINMKTHADLTPLLNPAAGDALTTSSTGWLGSSYLDFSDGYLIANYIGTPSFFISNAQDIIFDPLQFAGKTSAPDFVAAVVVQHRVLWVIGQLWSTEVWYDTGGSGGASNFPFQLMPGVAIDYGCIATYSIAKTQTSVFWLGQTQAGKVIVLRGTGYTVARISTHPIETILSTYATVSDCIAYCYLQQGHAFYVMNFPSADATWVFDLATDQWHERAYMDNSGEEHMQLSSMHAFAYGQNLVNDTTSGNLYAMDLKTYTDNGQPVKRVIGLPRQVDDDDDHRVQYANFTLEVAAGETLSTTDNPMITLRWSDDKGKTYSNGIIQPLGQRGKFNSLLKWNRLGLARSRVFQLEWSANAMVAIQSAFVTVSKAAA